MKKHWYVLSSFVVLVIILSFKASVYQFKLPVTSGVSLMRIGVDPHPLVEEGKEIAALVWDAVENNNMVSVVDMKPKCYQKISNTFPFSSVLILFLLIKELFVEFSPL